MKIVLFYFGNQTANIYLNMCVQCIDVFLKFFLGKIDRSSTNVKCLIFRKNKGKNKNTRNIIAFTITLTNAQYNRTLIQTY